MTIWLNVIINLSLHIKQRYFLFINEVIFNKIENNLSYIKFLLFSISLLFILLLFIRLIFELSSKFCKSINNKFNLVNILLLTNCKDKFSTLFPNWLNIYNK